MPDPTSSSLSDDPKGAAELSGMRPSATKPTRPRILCVDDEPCALSTLTRVLAGQFEIVTRGNPVEALSLLERDGDFAVVVADVNMPQMDGLKFLAAVREVSPTTTRLALTGCNVDTSTLPRGAVFRIIGKPCAPHMLRQIIIDAANYHALVAASPIQPIEGPPLRKPALLPLDGLTPDHRAQLEATKNLLDVTVAVAQPVVIHDRSPDVPLTLAPMARVGLRLLGRTVEMLDGMTIVGRSRTCHVPIPDRDVSRQHACFSNDGGELTVRNVSSTNRLLVNETPLELDERHPLQIGDRVKIGSHEIEVCVVGDYNPSIEPTQRFSEGAASSDSPGPTTTLATLSAVAEKYFRLGQGREAERILRPLLDGLLRYCRAHQAPLVSDVRLAVDQALGIAESNHAAEWIEYVFDLYSALGQPADQDVVERLYRLIPETSGIRMARFRAYMETLDRLQYQFGPAQRFLIRRIEGLQSRLLMSAHV